MGVNERQWESMSVLRVFLGCFKDVWGFQGFFMEISMLCNVCFWGISHFLRFHNGFSIFNIFLWKRLLEVLRYFQGFYWNFKGVSRKFQENVEGVQKKFHIACNSSQLPEQKEGLFSLWVVEDLLTTQEKE